MSKKRNEIISIIIPVYNVRNYLRRCVESIEKSHCSFIEIIIVDDGSTDDSYSLALSLKSEDERIILLKQENRGCAEARRKGLSVATGKYVGFVDPDDWIEPEMYERLFCAAEENETELVISNYFRDNDFGTYGEYKSIDVDEGIYFGERIEHIKRQIYRDGRRTINGALWNKLFIREKILNIYNYLDQRIYRGEDSVVVVLYLLECKRLTVINQAFYHAYDRPTSLTHTNDIEYFSQINFWYKQVYDYLVDSSYKVLLHGLEEFYITVLSEGMLRHTGCNINYRYDLNLIKYKRIILYGAGKVGRSYYEQFKKNNVNVVLWVDQNAENLDDVRISSIDRILDFEQEDIIVAIEAPEVALMISTELNEKYGVDQNRIIWSKPSGFEQMIHDWLYT